MTPGTLSRRTRSGRTGSRLPTRLPGRLLGLVLIALFPLAGGWLALLAGLMWWANAPIAVGWQPRVVLTGSMEPSVRPGDVILARRVDDPARLPLERLVVVRDDERDGGSYVHRFVRRDDQGRIVTKGDANRDEDRPAVADDRVIGEVRLVVPAIGLPVIWLRHNLAALVGSALITWAALTYVLHVMRSPRAGSQDDTRQDEAGQDEAGQDGARHRDPEADPKADPEAEPAPSGTAGRSLSR